MENWSRIRNGNQLIVTLKIRHLQDPDFRNALQDIVHELRHEMSGADASMASY